MLSVSEATVIGHGSPLACGSHRDKNWAEADRIRDALLAKVSS